MITEAEKNIYLTTQEVQQILRLKRSTFYSYVGSA